ncbi:hypothetical protein [Nocardia jiangsuensis]|uniref:Uncharacterized protein n=1 Tax=Nocardia jiangsuensis TaxID=1691563 RepID=A0ABV8DKQ5_9NOCA
MTESSTDEHRRQSIDDDLESRSTDTDTDTDTHDPCRFAGPARLLHGFLFKIIRSDYVRLRKPDRENEKLLLAMLNEVEPEAISRAIARNYGRGSIKQCRRWTLSSLYFFAIILPITFFIAFAHAGAPLAILILSGTYPSGSAAINTWWAALVAVGLCIAHPLTYTLSFFASSRRPALIRSRSAKFLALATVIIFLILPIRSFDYSVSKTAKASLRGIEGLTENTRHIPLVFMTAIGTAALAGIFTAMFVSLGRWLLLDRVATDEALYSVNRHLLHAYSLLRKEGALATDAIKLEAIGTLRQAAESLYRSTPRQYRRLATFDRSVISGRCYQAAEVFKSYTLWVALPGRSTQEDLCQLLQESIVAIALGHYHDLPTVDKVKRPSLSLKFRAAFALIRSLLGGLIPISLIICVKFLGIDVGGSTIANGMVVFALAWISIVLISALDSNLPTRLILVRDFIAAIKEGASK